MVFRLMSDPLIDWFVVSPWWHRRSWSWGTTQRMKFKCYEIGPIRIRNWGPKPL